MNKINVNLYGGKSLFSSKETPLEADVIYCDSCNECSLYKEEKCLNCRSVFGIKCDRGKVETSIGYTSRARKYLEFRNKYENDEVYNKLSYPNNYVWLIGDILYLKLVYTRVTKPKKEDEYLANKFGYVIEDGYGSSVFSINKSDINIDLFANIFSYTPRAFMGGIIKDYQDKIVPNVINELKKVVPKIYHKLLLKYPEFDREPNYIGRYAFLKTLVDGSEVVDCHGNKAIKQGNILYCKNFTKGFVPFDGESAECTIKIKEKQKYKITNNEQCDENTLFE